jgi:2-methylcitrate dehydratase
MRGESGPSPVYEGAESAIAAFLGGADRVLHVGLPGAGEPKRAILDSFTKEHSVAYHCQSMVDLAFRMRRDIEDLETIETVTIHSKHQTHMVTGSGSNDPQKYDPKASRETLDHSIMFAFAVALEDGEWHHERSYAPERRARPETIRLWRKVKTVEDDEWNRRYREAEPLRKPQGGRVEITFTDREPLIDQIDFADAHTLGARPFARPDYIAKFETLADGVIEADEIARFLESAQELPALASDALGGLNVEAPPGSIECAKRDNRGIF